jgi:hypothetical protein
VLRAEEQARSFRAWKRSVQTEGKLNLPQGKFNLPRVEAPGTSPCDFTGFVQWDRQECVGTDELHGHTAGGKLSLRFDTIRSIARRSRDSSLVTLRWRISE